MCGDLLHFARLLKEHCTIKRENRLQRHANAKANQLMFAKKFPNWRLKAKKITRMIEINRGRYLSKSSLYKRLEEDLIMSIPRGSDSAFISWFEKNMDLKGTLGNETLEKLKIDALDFEAAEKLSSMEIFKVNRIQTHKNDFIKLKEALNEVDMLSIRLERKVRIQCYKQRFHNLEEYLGKMGINRVYKKRFRFISDIRAICIKLISLTRQINCLIHKHKNKMNTQWLQESMENDVCREFLGYNGVYMKITPEFEQSSSERKRCDRFVDNVKLLI